MGGELGHDRLRNINKWLGRVLVAIGICTVIVGLVLSVPHDTLQTGIITALCGFGVVALGVPLWLGRRLLMIALLIDGAIIAFAGFPFSDLVGWRGYALTLVGVAVGVLAAATAYRSDIDESFTK